MLSLFLPLLAMAQGGAPVPLADRPVVTPVIEDPDLLSNVYEMLIPAWAAAIHLPGLDIFLTLLGIEVGVFCVFLVIRYRADGTLQGVMASVVTKILALSFFLTLALNGQQWMGWIINALPEVAKKATGMPGLTPGRILAQGLRIAGILWHTAFEITGFTGMVAGLGYLCCGMMILLAFLVLAVDLLMAKTMAAVSLGCGGIMLFLGASRWTVGYTERFFSLGIYISIRLYVLYFMVAAGWSLTDTWIAKAKAAPAAGNGFELAALTFCGAAMYVIICVGINHVVAAKLTGSMGFGHGDFAAMAGPAIAAAVSAGMLAGGVALKSVGAAVGGGGKGASAAGGAGMVTPSGWTGRATPPQATPPSGSGGGGFRGGSGGGAVRVAAMNGMRSMMNASASGRGGHASPPKLNGFDH